MFQFLSKTYWTFVNTIFKKKLKKEKNLVDSGKNWILRKTQNKVGFWIPVSYSLFLLICNLFKLSSYGTNNFKKKSIYSQNPAFRNPGFGRKYTSSYSYDFYCTSRTHFRAPAEMKIELLEKNILTSERGGVPVIQIVADI